MWLFPHMTKVTCLHIHNFMKKLNKNEVNLIHQACACMTKRKRQADILEYLIVMSDNNNKVKISLKEISNFFKGQGNIETVRRYLKELIDNKYIRVYRKGKGTRPTEYIINIDLIMNNNSTMAG